MAVTTSDIHAEDLVPVRSRVSWGAIFAGAMVALAVYFLFNLLGAAVGLSVRGYVGENKLDTAGIIWGVLATLISLFLGGWVTSQLAVGENKMEAAIYGVILWGVIFAMLLGLMVTGLQLGLTGMVAVASGQPNARGAAQDVPSVEALERAGVPRDQIDRVRNSLQGLSPETVAQAAWWAFGGTLLSMVAAVAGAVAGSGPTLVLRRVVVRTTAPGRV
jgi:hypothetical protein